MKFTIVHIPRNNCKKWFNTTRTIKTIKITKTIKAIKIIDLIVKSYILWAAALLIKRKDQNNHRNIINQKDTVNHKLLRILLSLKFTLNLSKLLKLPIKLLKEERKRSNLRKESISKVKRKMKELIRKVQKKELSRI